MVIWIIFKNHVLKVLRTQNRGTLALQTLGIADLSNFVMCEDLHIKIPWKNTWMNRGELA